MIVELFGMISAYFEQYYINYKGNEDIPFIRLGMAYISFAEKEKTEILFNLVNEFNAKQVTASKIHVVILNVEKSN